MHRCDNANSSGTGTGAYDPSVAIYRDENPPSYDATQLRHQEMNAIQEEICNVIRAEGYSLNTDAEVIGAMTQLNTAISNKMFADRIVNNSGVSGSFVDDALDQLDADILALTSDDIANSSSVSGTNVSDALDNLDTDSGDDFHSATPVSSPSRTLTVFNKRGRIRKLDDMAIVTWNMIVSGDGDMNYIRIPLPSGYDPAGTFHYDMEVSKVACVEENGGYTDIEGIYAQVFEDSGTSYLYIGNKELVDQAPTTTSFSGSTDYHIRINHIYRLA